MDKEIDSKDHDLYDDLKNGRITIEEFSSNLKKLMEQRKDILHDTITKQS